MARAFSIKGPARDGAMALDEGALTKAVVDRLGAASGADGNRLAGEIWTARRDLWRVLETCVPLVVAKHLRRRAAKAQDYSNRGAVGDLRRLVADWLDPPEPTCPGCRRPVRLRHAHRRKRPQAPAVAALPGRGVASAGGRALTAWRDAVAAWEAERARQVAKHLAMRREWVRRVRERTPGRGSPLDLFGVARASEAARPRLVAHGDPARLDGAPVSPFPGEARPRELPAARRYDVEVDRDGAVLREAVRETLGDDLFAALAGGDDPVARHLATRARAARTGEAVRCSAADPDAHPLARAFAGHVLVAAAWWRFCRALEAGFEANGRLYLKAQGKYSPAGSVTRADLVQESAGGAIRGLYDFNPQHGKHGCKVSTYIVSWCRQGMSKAIQGRDEVATPAWVRDLRANLERGGVDLRAARTAVEACAAVRPAPLEKAATRAEVRAWTAARRREDEALAADVLRAVRRPSSAPVPAQQVAALAADLLARAGEVDRQEVAGRHLAAAAGLVVKAPPQRASGGRKGVGEGKRTGKAKAAPKRKRGDPVGVTGAGVLQALRFEDPRRHSLVFGDGNDDSGDAPYDPRSREPADEADPERLLLVAETEAAARDGLASLADALEALRREDPRACEVVRRREGLGEQGDGETLAQIAEGLDADAPRRRALSREETSRLYRVGVARLRVLVGNDDLFHDDDDDVAAPEDAEVEAELRDLAEASARRRRSGTPWRTIRPAVVRTDVAEPDDRLRAPPLVERVQALAYFESRDEVDAIAW